MRGYDNEGDDYEDYYEDDGQDEYEEEGEEEYEEEKEEPKPSKEELEYLELRQKLKESIRKQMKKESNGSSASRLDSTDRRKDKLPYDNYGSFFGPSRPVIAQRVIQESKSLLENQHLASRISNPHHIKKNLDKVPSGGSKSSSHNPPPKVNEMKVKAQKLKNTRDYSFLLSDDAELQAPPKAPLPQNMPIRNSEGRPAQAPARSKLHLSNAGKYVRASHEERRPGSASSRLPPKSGSSHKTNSASQPSMMSANYRKLLGNNSANGPGRPVGQKRFPSNISVGSPGNKSSTRGIKNPVNVVQRSLLPKTHPNIPKQTMEPRKDIRELNRPKVTPKQPLASSKQQISKPLKQHSMHAALQDHRPKPKVAKRRPFDEEEDNMDISNMIRSMFNYNPKKFVDDDDDDNMEAGFDEIMREERRSSLIAKKEDEEQLRLIEEEEERERRRRAKLKKRAT